VHDTDCHRRVIDVRAISGTLDASLTDGRHATGFLPSLDTITIIAGGARPPPATRSRRDV